MSKMDRNNSKIINRENNNNNKVKEIKICLV